MYYYLVDWIIKNGEIPLPPNGSYNDYYRIINSPCIKTYIGYDGRKYYSQCKDACCWEHWGVEVSLDGEVTKTYYGGEGVSVICPDEDCTSICGRVPTKIHIPAKVVDRGIDIQTIVKPNPSNGLIYIEIISEYIGPIEIYCYNDVSYLVFNYEHNKISQNEIIKIDVNSFFSGTYFYEIRINGKNYHNGKFSVTK